jgi:hypothetical protein
MGGGRFLMGEVPLYPISSAKEDRGANALLTGKAYRGTSPMRKRPPP